MSNLITRLITGVIGGAVVVGAIFLSYRGLWLFGTVVSMVCLWEFMHGARLAHPKYLWSVIAFGVLIWGLAWILPGEQDVVLIGAMMVILPSLEVLTLLFKKDDQFPQNLGLMVLGFFYCLIPLLLFYKMAVPDDVSEYDPKLPMGILVLIWSLDSTAFFVGRAFGKTLLYPRVSPKKTWEGAVGGAVGCLIAGAILMNQWPIHRISGFNWLIVAAIISVFSQLGDLVESSLKRSMELKDSGNILPGHGGMLDRFDGFMLSVPFIYLYFIYLYYILP